MIYQINTDHIFWSKNINMKTGLYFSLNDTVYHIYDEEINRSCLTIDHFNKYIHNKMLICHSPLEDRLLQEL